MSSHALGVLAPTKDPITLSTLQPGLSTFHTPDGYVAYVQQGRTTITLGAPVSPPDAMADLARAFLEKHPAATFFYVTEEQRQWMGLEDHFSWPAGADFIVTLPAPGWPREVAAASRKARKAGFRMREIRPEELPALETSMREAQKAYLARREVASEMRFLTRPCLFSLERLGRTFALEVGAHFLGFVVIDPYVTSSGAPGYLLNLFRIGPTRLWGVYQACVVELAGLLSAEGARELSLGFVPLAPVSMQMPWWLEGQLLLLRQLAQRSPYLQGLSRIKSGLPSRQVPRLFVTRRKFIGRDLRTFLGAMGIPAYEVAA